MASGSRMIYAMARDSALIGNSKLRSVSRTTSAPVPAILLVAGLGIIAELFFKSLEQLLAAAAVLPALIYLSTVSPYGRRRHSLFSDPDDDVGGSVALQTVTQTASGGVGGLVSGNVKMAANKGDRFDQIKGALVEAVTDEKLKAIAELVSPARFPLTFQIRAE